MSETNNKNQRLLYEVQQKLKVPKNQYNAFGKYKYRNCEDILEELKKVIPEGCSVVLSDEIVNIGERYYVKAVATFVCEGMFPVSTVAYAREPDEKKGMDASQITGSASSYARKYALSGLFAIDDNADIDEPEEKPKFKQKEASGAIKTINDSQAKIIYELINESNSSYEKLCEHYNVKTLLDLNIQQYNDALNLLSHKKEKMREHKNDNP